MLFSWKMDQINYFVFGSIGDKEGEIFPNFESLPCFNIDVQPELVNNNFSDEKKSLISCQRNANDNSSNQKTKSDLSVWIPWQPSTVKNDFNRFTKNNRCSNMNGLPFISPKKLTTNVYKTKRSSAEWLISSIN